MTEPTIQSAAAASGQALASAALKHAKQLVQQSDFARAEQTLIEALPDSVQALTSIHVELLYVLSVAQRQQRNFKSAIQSINTLIQLEPRHARAYQELAHCLLSINEVDPARDAFIRAIQINPALLGSWKAIEQICRSEKNHSMALKAEQEIAYLEGLPTDLLIVSGLLYDNKLAQADQKCREFLRSNKQHVEGMRLLAKIGERLNRLLDAEFLIETVLALEPGHIGATRDYGNLLLRMQKFAKAHEVLEELCGKYPENQEYLALLANAKSGVGEHQRAIRLYKKLLANAPNQEMLSVMCGHAEKTIGKTDEAIKSYQDAYKIRSNYGDAFWSLANTKTYRFSDTELNAMRRGIEMPNTPAEDKIHLSFALGKGLEDRKEFDESFRFYNLGNQLKKGEVQHSCEFVERRVNNQIEVCREEVFSKAKGFGCLDHDPIFIVGLPRAGSTLLEQILASHSMVDGTHELPNIIALTQRLRRGGRNAMDSEENDANTYPHILREIDLSYLERFGRQFIEETKIFREGASLFIDKNPNNFFHIGLIKLILPNAKIIDARRAPLDCCFSVFKQLFGQGQGFSYGLKEVGHYYAQYLRLMDHWDAVLPGFVLKVQHEDVVQDLESQVTRMLDFCGLPFERACLDFHNTDRSVRTPSSEQVRTPVNRSGMDRWKPYRDHLGPLFSALEGTLDK